MEQELLVSICCITYNQKKYIKEALNSFLAQKTNFKYEVVIYDDASTDGTKDIIQEYQKKYPDIIKPIFAIENQYSKGKQTLLYPLQEAKGKYIAICEGDDYWMEENKLQIQVNYMQKNPECSFCFHNAYVLCRDKKEKFINSSLKYKKYRQKDGNYHMGDIHLFGIGVAPTASFMFLTKYVKNIPEWFEQSICGDMPIKLIMTSFGYAHYIDEIMSVYRKEVENSVTQQWKKQNNTIDKKVKHLKQIIEILEQLNEFTKGKYEKGLGLSKKYYEIEILMAEKKYRELFKLENFKYYRIVTNDILGLKLMIKMLIHY